MVIWYMVLCQIPIYGAQKGLNNDPIEGLRPVLASNKGTLAEFGILPLITSEFFFLILKHFKILVPNKNSMDERNLYDASNKGNL